MTISDEVQALQTNLTDSYSAVSNKGGTLPQDQCFDNLPNAISTISTGGTINSLNVTPSTSAQTITASGGVDGFNPVNVSAVTSSIDNNITAGNIKDGVTILGVTGTVEELNATSLNVTQNGAYTPSNPYNAFNSVDVSVDTVNNTSLTITPSTSVQSFTPSSPYTGYDPVSVSAVDATIDPNIVSGNIVTGKSILGVAGSATVLNGETKSVSLTNSAGQTFTPSTGKNAITSITVTPNNQARTVTPTTSQQTLTVNSGYSGNGTVTVNAVTSAIDSNITSANIVSGKSILGVNGSAVVLNGETRTVSITSTAGNTFTPSSGKNGITSIKVTPTNKAQTITPSTSSQTIPVPSGYSGNGEITVNAVTASIDPNIVPNKIRNGCVILGVTGTYGEPMPILVSLSINTSGYVIDEEFYLCGNNDYGQQGSGNTTRVTTFTKRAENVAQIFCTDNTTGYVTTSGDFYLCGYNNYGQQGSGNTTDVTTFTKRAENVAQIFGSTDTTGYLTTSGDFYLCGRNYYGQQGNGTSGSSTNVTTFTKRAENVVQIFCMTGTTGYLTTSGDFYLCGINNRGQQGDGTQGSSSKVTTFTKRAENVAQIFGSINTTGYLTTSGDFYLCGYNNYGQQGSGNTTDVTTFTKRAENVAQIFYSGSTTGYLTTSGDFYLCGGNTYGEQGNGTSGSSTYVTTFTKRAENVAQIYLSQNTTGYVTTSGDFYLCGNNDYGQQGSGNTTRVTTFTKRAENVAQIFSSSTQTTGYVTTSGDFYLCGNNDYGQQGSGNTVDVTTFTKRN